VLVGLIVDVGLKFPNRMMGTTQGGFKNQNYPINLSKVLTLFSGLFPKRFREMALQTLVATPAVSL